MVGSPARSSWFALSALALGAFAVEWGCAVDPSQGEGLSEAVRDALVGMLEDVWPEVVQDTLGDAKSAAADLHIAAQAWSEDSGSETARDQAQTAWFEAMDAWQQMELMQLGPAGSSLKVIGGQDLRDEIYSWPTTNPCRVDQATARLEFEANDFFDTALVNSTGLDALETVIFSTPNENDCPAQVSINSEGTWAALGADGVAAARADYAVVLAKQVVSDIAGIENRWTDGFSNNLKTAGQSGSDFESELVAVNAIFDAIFYLEVQVKDHKLGWALGITDCGKDDCSDELESPTAGSSQRWLAANLRGFRHLYTGGEGLGLEDLLVAVGEESLANEVIAALNEADTAVAAIDNPLDIASEDSLTEAHQAVKAVTDLLKSDIATVLTLSLPTEAAGDND
jgi:uncharacterized protein